MRFVVTGEWSKNRFLKTIVWCFLIYTAVLWLSNAGLYFAKMSLDPASVVEYYRGDPERYLQPRSYVGLLETLHFHSFAMGILLTGRSMSAADAARLGLVNEISAPGKVLETARKWAEDMLSCAPLALQRSKQLAVASANPASLRAPLQKMEIELTDELIKSHDGQEGLAAFAERRAPVWTGQ